LNSSLQYAIVKWEKFLPERSKAMTDWDLMVEYIQQAMQGLDKAHEATRELREKVTPESIDQFQRQMEELKEQLTKLQTVLDNQEAFALDEQADRRSQAFSGRQFDYRRTRVWRFDLR
jgi:vacuolar-type H+-ATPase subunit I/STV1